MVSTVELNREEHEEERLFFAAGRYPLLSAAEERSLDSAKWEALGQMLQLMQRDSDCRDFIASWARYCITSPPDLASIDSRDQLFLLRRELSELLATEGASDRLEQLAAQGRQDGNEAAAHALLAELDLPASLVAAIAELCTADGDPGKFSSAAGALRAWQLRWPDAAARRLPRPAGRCRRAIAQQLALYGQARSGLVLHNLRLVYSIAGRYRDRGVPFPDLAQEGTLGLIRAAEKFRSSKGFRFSTYAFNWISQAVRRCVAEAGGQIRFPGHVQEQLARLHGERARLAARGGQAVTDTELAEALGIDTERTRSLLQLRNLGTSLDAPGFPDDKSAALIDKLPDPGARRAFAAAENRSLRRFLLAEIGRLEPAEQRVVIARWGLHRGPALSRGELADQMAVSTEWIRQLEQSALQKLRSSQQVSAVFEDYSGDRT